jgi:hypothetical protein
MTVPTCPLYKNWPYLDRVVEGDMPLLGSILFGFSGAYFSALITTEKKFEDIIVGPFKHILVEISVRSTILVVLGLCCLLFQLCITSAIYAKMINPSSFAYTGQAPPSRNQRKADEDAIKELMKRRRKWIVTSIWSFNLGLALLLESGLLLLPDVPFLIATAILIASIGYLLYQASRLHRASRAAQKELITRADDPRPTAGGAP